MGARIVGVMLCMFIAGCNIDVTVSGKGTVISDPFVVNCRESSGTCRIKRYERLKLDVEDMVATLRAIPDEDHAFVDWEGDCDEEVGNKCRVVLGSDIRVRAIFKPVSYVTELGPVEKQVNFIAMGDTGTGDAGQYAVGRAIASWCATRQCDLVLGMGDNFYGSAPSHVYSSSFEERFELPYSDADIPFYMVLGNHDTGRYEDGDGGNQTKGNVQVEYHYRRDRSSEKWQMPARYYKFSLPVGDPNPLVEFFALDSAPFVGAWDPSNAYPPSSYARTQGQWLSDAMAQSKATWKLAFAHHPYVSNGKHGNASNYDGAPVASGEVLEKLNGVIFRKFMESYVCNKVDWYFSGHDHNIQLLKSVGPCGLTQFGVSGVGAKANGLERQYDNQTYFRLGHTLGFLFIEVIGNQITTNVIAAGEDGTAPEIIYSESFNRMNLSAF